MFAFVPSSRQPLATAFAFICLSLSGLAAPLSFQSALDLAEQSAPQLAAQAAGIASARAAAIPAGALPNPKLFVGIDNLPVSGMDRWRIDRDFMTMQKIGVMQDVPNADKRQARIEAADAAVARSEVEQQLARLTVRRETALAWINRYYLERKVDLFDALERENALLADAIRAQLAGGRGALVDALLPKQDAAMLAERRDEFSRDLNIANAALGRWVGIEAYQPLLGVPPDYQVELSRIHHRLLQHPALTLFDTTAAITKAQVKEAEAGRKSDWGVEVAYQRRAPQFGNMMSVQLTVDLPILQSSRQGPQVAAKQAELAKLEAERESALREHTQALATDVAEYTRLERAIARQQSEFLLWAEQKVALQTASYRAGKAELTAVLSARRELMDARLKTIDLTSQRAQLAARLHFNYGEVQP